MFLTRLTNRPTRRWWQHIGRAGALFLVVLAGLYVTLPYWAPTGLISQYLAGVMAEQMAVNVRIGSMSLSWSNGVELRDLTIESPSGFGGGTMVAVRSRAELAPIDLFCRKQIEWMLLDEPRAFVQVDDQGNVNLAALQKLNFEAQPRRISVRQARATVKLPGHQRLLGVSVKDAEYLAGRIQKLGRVTVSALLHQQGAAAPVSLRLAADSRHPGVLADALFNFANVDLSQIPLAKLLGLPLRKLSGRCRGSLDLQIDRQSVVDQFSFNLLIRDLEAQPEHGPTLPVIPEAGLRISAVFDPVTENLTAGLVDIRSASVRLPGIDLAGRASLSTDILRGQWEAINSLHLEGNVHPGRLVALLTGRPKMPGKVELTGPMAVELAVDRLGALFTTQATLDAGGVEILHAGEVIKPAGQRLEMQIKAALDRRNWQLRIGRDDVSLYLGANRFTGGGSISDVRSLVKPLPNGRPAGHEIFRRLALLDWQGACQISELEPLLELARPLTSLPVPLKLAGQMTGNWSIKQFPDTQIQLGLLVPAESHFAVGEFFVKEATTAQGKQAAGRTLSLEVSGKIDPQRQAVRMLDVDIVVGEGRLSISNGTVRFGPESAGSLGLLAEGRFDGQNTELLRPCLPAWSGQSKGTLRGRINGQFRFSLADGLIAAEIEADLAELDVDWGRIVRKPTGQPGKLAVNFRRDCTSASDGRCQVDIQAEFAQARFLVGAEFSRPLWRSGPAGFSLVGRIKDAQWLAKTFPFVAEALAGGQLTGTAELEASGSWQPKRVNLELSCNGDGLQFVTGGPIIRSKAAAVPLRMHLAGSLATSGELKTLEISRAEARFDQSTLSLVGRAIADWPQKPMLDRPLPIDFAKQYQAKLSLELSLSEALLKLVGELAEPAEEFGLGGKIVADMRLVGDGGKISAVSHVDAGQLAVGHVGPLAPIAAIGRSPAWAIKIGPFTKPAGVSASAEIELTAPADLSRVQVNNLRVNLGGVEILADALMELTPPEQPWSLPKRTGKAEAHLAVWVQRAEMLTKLAPFLARHKPTGDVFLDLQFVQQDGERVITSAHVRADRLSGHYHGKDVALAGRASFQNIRLRQGETPRVGRFKTDGLELRAGRNLCWLIAELTNLPDQARGSFHLLGAYLDDKDLLEWFASFGGADQPLTTPAGQTRPASQPGPPYRLTASETERLLKAADKQITELRRYLLPAQLTGRVSIDRLRTFDPSVGQFYEVRQVELRSTVDRGHVAATYVAGLNGGTIRSSYDTRLSDATAIVAYQASMRDVVATENIQPQLAKYFPGNTVKGLFNRTEQSTAALWDLLANLMDHRHPTRPAGTAETITTDGLVEGRAAPRFVTRIFPGLNLTKYHYNKMTSFAAFHPDGVAENDMVFSGHTYDMYIEGTTDAENIGRYGIGLILLGTPQSAEWNHRYRQGRIPILKLKARIEGGKMHDEVVSYPWPNESLFVIFLKNNIFYRIWLAAKNRPVH